MRRDGPPASDWIQTSVCRAFFSSSTVVTVNARVLPSGDSVPPPTRAILYQSSGVKARLPWAASAVADRSRMIEARFSGDLIGIPGHGGGCRRLIYVPTRRVAPIESTSRGPSERVHFPFE